MYTLQGYTLTLSLLCPFLPRVRWCSILQLCLWWGRGASGTIPSQTLWILPSTFITSSSSQSCSTSLVSSLLPIPLQPTCSLVPRPSWQVKEGLAFWVAFFCHMGQGLRHKDCQKCILHPGLELSNKIDMPCGYEGSNKVCWESREWAATQVYSTSFSLLQIWLHVLYCFEVSDWRATLLKSCMLITPEPLSCTIKLYTRSNFTSIFYLVSYIFNVTKLH